MSNERSSNDEDDISFISQIRSNPLLEKEEAYLKTNQELEKKTSDLIMRLEKFSRSRSLCSSSSLYNGGETGSEFGTDDGISSFGDGDTMSLKGFSTSSQIDQDEHNCLGHLKHSNSSTSLFEKLALLSSIAPEDMGEEKEKKPSRLQRATESVIKSLHSKLLNHEDRLADLHLQHRHKIQENTILESKIKALEEERERFLRTITNLQGIVEKHAKQAESSKSNLSVKMQTVTSMKKEMGDHKRENQLLNATTQSLQTRLNRALEEIDRLKNQNKSSNHNLREVQSDNKIKLELQRQKILDLEKQKLTLNATIKKQANLIKAFRDQKSHGSPGK